MENLNRNTIIYSLNVDDIQNVAFDEIGRELSQSEIEQITDSLAANIDWYSCIANTIRVQKLH